MFAIGHIALGYISGKIVGKYCKDQGLKIPVLLAMSIMPDLDLLVSGLEHRGPTHSLLLALIIFMPFLVLRFRRTFPYFAALASHSFGDYITDGGVKMFWPISSAWIKYRNTLSIGSVYEAYVELTLFIILILTLILSLDIKFMFNWERSNIVILAPLLAVIIPILIKYCWRVFMLLEYPWRAFIFKYPVTIPKILIIPHLILFCIMAISLIMFPISIIKKHRAREKVS